MGEISWNDFEKIDIRVGTVTSAQPFPEARNRAYKLEIDFGELGVKRSSAQITVLYSIDDLIGQQVVAVVNFPPKQIATMMSECLVLGLYGEDGAVTLIQPQKTVKNGARLG